MEWGTTFSHRFLRDEGLGVREALEAFTSLGLSWVRVGAYWDEIEPESGEYQFGELDRVVEKCLEKGLKIVMTVGMKAPRWPEFYIPQWATGEEVLGFLASIVKHYESAVNVWQVENEPLDPSGPEELVVPVELLEKEVALVRQLDPGKQIMLTAWGNQLSKRGVYRKLGQLADIIGIDLYPKVPTKILNRLTVYRGPEDAESKLLNMLASVKREMWIAELQAEPWGSETSVMPEDVVKNIDYAKRLQPDVCLLWGFEWWYRRKLLGDDGFWRVITCRV